ncbi:MAG: UDP-N-acetylmuramoyl-L-alanyl-D-glutamate--2,6-diaminopimelate ligase [Endomicrobia bacterium]|nr:UDP-N-acetylmuramoyl-L-alanyl-D-glutamate--2,6-diaminopimelate ligase [Endomicrobiia bacterium]
MKLKDILPLDNEVVYGNDEIEIAQIAYDSRKIGKDYLFFALPGHTVDGKKYISDAVKNGAIAVVSDTFDAKIPVTQIVVKDIFHYMSLFSAKFYNYPDRELKIIGITGTNGKTTITYMIESILARMNEPCGVIGTVSYRYAGKTIEAENTTPQSLDLYKMMREMRDGGVKYLAMEVSSHALSIGRVFGIEFDIAAFTNLTRDHLDFHKDFESYFEAKSMLFKGLKKASKRFEKFAIINADDAYGLKLSKIPLEAEIKLYSVKKESDFKAENVSIESGGTNFDVVYKNQKEKVSIKHIGLHNVYNALTALGCVICLGKDFKDAVEGLNASSQAPGRLERVDSKNSEFEVIVDYAHTDDALKNVLSALKDLPHNRLITVFGCGGDRDRTKRPLMGKTAAEMSDFVFITSDNPRTEDPKQIILDIEVGIKRAEKRNYKVAEDRDNAIKEAVMMAEKGDIILLAGKGHETYQIIGHEKYHFNDIEVAQKYISLKEKQRDCPKQIEQKEFDF